MRAGQEEWRDLEEAIRTARQAVEVTPEDHPNLAAFSLLSLPSIIKLFLRPQPASIVQANRKLHVQELRHVVQSSHSLDAKEGTPSIPVQGGRSHLAFSQTPSNPSAIFLKPVCQFVWIDVFVPIMCPPWHDANQRCFGDDFRGEEAHGGARDGGANKPSAGFEVSDCRLEELGGCVYVFENFEHG